MTVALATVAGVLIMLLLYGGSMFGYFRMRQKFSSAKYAVEIAVLAFAVIFSISLKWVVFYISETPGNNFWHNLSTAFKAIYSGIGGLTFEGLSDFGTEEVKALVQCLYTGSSLYAGLMILSVLTAKVSYEIYSGLRILFSFKMRAKAKNTDFYIFSAITEESLTLANSINDHYINNPRKCAIIFAGDKLEVFDSKNDLHREIMSRGYLFWSYAKKDKNDKGVFAHLHIPVMQDFFKEKPQSEAEECRIRFFAMDTNEKLSGLESENSRAVFYEINCLLGRFFKKSEDKNALIEANKNQVIDFYVLTDNDINYEFYKRELFKLIKNKFNQLFTEEQIKNSYKTVYEEVQKDNYVSKENKENEFFARVYSSVARYFQLYVINEAYLAGKCLSKARRAEYLKDYKPLIKKEEELTEEEKIENAKRLEVVKTFVNASEPLVDNEYRVMVLGFGTNGQQSMKHLYRSTAYVDEKLRPSRFVADVYDPQAEDTSGLFGFDHPMFICVNKGTDVGSVEKTEWAEGDARLKEYYKDLSNYPEQVKDQLVFPVVAFHKVSAFEYNYLDFLDKKTGSLPRTKSIYNAFIIAMGNDEYNIHMANALISDIKHEQNLTSSLKSFSSTIYVNIRDKENYGRINWVEQNKEELNGLKVVIYGSSEEMFSYSTVINDFEAMKFDYSYNNVINEEKHSKLFSELIDIIELKEGVSIPKAFEQMKEIFNAPTIYYDMRAGWLKRDTYKKQSNYAISDFYLYYALSNEVITQKEELNIYLANRLSAIEHERWNRFNVANGWIYSATRHDEIKEHKCICAYDMLSSGKKVYDLGNVALSILKGEEIKSFDSEK